MQVGAAALSPIIAVVGGWIAWQQVRINRNKLKLDRFDKRYSIYEASMNFATSIIADGKLTSASYEEFLAQTRGARFLLNKEMADYLEQLNTNAVKLNGVLHSQERPSITEEQWAKYGDRITEITTWFQQQLEVIPERLGPFLSVKDI
ncbi:hypothetical protein [Caballeronia sordidicola]|uniref:hypothetical protein n=1 Tax=Caballeronia sordidicola TaxID=196367 RepID=UPI0004D00F18|nr:hypothetical protein [Caballeronia sordidicola]